MFLARMKGELLSFSEDLLVDLVNIGEAGRERVNPVKDQRLVRMDLGGTRRPGSEIRISEWIEIGEYGFLPLV